VPPVPTNRDSSGRETAVAITLHWVMALGIPALSAIGLTMVHLTISLHRKLELYQLRKSIGVTILVAAGSGL
jgi:cytochrome b561